MEEYTFAVAQLRAYEARLLTPANLEQMISAQTLREAAEVLEAHGWAVPEEGDPLALPEQHGREMWELVSSLAPDSRELRVFTVLNDFHNLKASLKALAANSSPENCFTYPTSLDTSRLPKLVQEKNWDALPAELQEPAEKAYEALVRTSDGQRLDVYLDRCALECLQKQAAETKNEFLCAYAALVTVSADIRTAVRAAAAGKAQDSLEEAICGSELLDKALLVRAAAKGRDGVLDFLASGSEREAGSLYAASASAFEKYCDDRITDLLEDVRLKSDGIEPVLAFWLATVAEIRNVRILLVCKASGADKSTVTERMRKTYV